MNRTHHRKKATAVLLCCAAALALCAGIAAFLLCPARAQAVAIPGARGSIPATVQLPCRAKRGSNMPLIVMCHGFTGNREGDGHFAPLAEDLAAQGIASVRLDFAGCGDSTEPFTNYTLSNMTADVDAAIAYMQAQYGTGATALVGHSMGGRLASLYPQRGQYPVAALALWSPANGTGLQGLEFLHIEDFAVVEDYAAAAEASGSVTAWDVPLSREFFAEMRDSDPNASLRAAALPTLLTYSGNENILSAATQVETIAAVQSLPHGQVALEEFAAGNHNYTADDPAVRQSLDEALRRCTADFLCSAFAGKA